MRNKYECIFNNPKTLSLIGYFIIADNNIYAEQMFYTEKFITDICRLNIDEYRYYYYSIIEGNEESVTYSNAVYFYKQENIMTKKILLSFLICINEFNEEADNATDSIIR